MPYYVCAAAYDYKGNVSPMWRSEELDWSKMEPRPIEELIEKGIYPRNLWGERQSPYGLVIPNLWGNYLKCSVLHDVTHCIFIL